MKRCLTLIIILLSLNVLLAQQNNSLEGDQIVILIDGTIFRIKISKENPESVQCSKGGETFNLLKKNIRLYIPANLVDSTQLETESLIIFKNNDWLKAQILEVSQKAILLKCQGQISYFPTSKIYKIFPASNESIPDVEFLEDSENYTFLNLSKTEKNDDHKKQNKFYNKTSAKLLIGNSAIDNIEDFGFTSGIGLQHTFGYEFSKYLGVGVSLGLTEFRVTSYIPPGPNCSISITGCVDRLNDIRINAFSSSLILKGELSQEKIRPYYSLEIGIRKSIRSQTVKNEIIQLENFEDFEFDRQASKTLPGYLIQPSLGLQFKMNTMDLVVDVGFQFGNLNYDVGFLRLNMNQSASTIIEQDKIRALVLRLGILL